MKYDNASRTVIFEDGTKIGEDEIRLLFNITPMTAREIREHIRVLNNPQQHHSKPRKSRHPNHIL